MNNVMKKVCTLGVTTLVCALPITFGSAVAATEYSGDCLIEPMIVTEVGSPVQGVMQVTAPHRYRHRPRMSEVWVSQVAGRQVRHQEALPG